MRSTSTTSGRGFTLVEMLIALTLGLLVIGAAVDLFSRGVSATWLISQRAELQQNARASSNLLNKDISLAGSGLPSGGVALASGTASKPVYGCDYTGACHLGPTNTGSITYPNQVDPVSGKSINFLYGVIPGWKGGVTVNGAAGATDVITVVYADTAFLLSDYTVKFNDLSGNSVTFTLPAPPPNPLDQAVNNTGVGLQQGDLVFAEVDMDFHATKERPEFPFGHLRPGDTVTVKFFVTYRLRNGRVVELKSMTWPPGKGVTQLPRLGAHPSQQAAFRAYTAAFSNADFDRFPTFYTEDVQLELGSVPTISGRQGIIDFYRPMFERVREQLTVNSVTMTDASIELDAITRFTAVQDAPDFVVGALKAGEYIEGRVLVSYRLRDGLIAHIGVRRGGEMRKHP